MSVETIVLKRPYWLSLKSTVKSHGWYGLAPWGWDERSESMSRPERLPSGVRARIEARQGTPSSIQVAVESTGLGPIDLEWARATVARWLSADWDPAEAIALASHVDPAVATAIGEGGGRFLRGSTFYEDFAKTVCTIQIAWSGTRRMVKSLVNELGDGLFPTPRNILDAGESTLRANIRLGFRAPNLVESTEQLLERGLMDDSGRGGAEGRITYDELISLPGIGPYAASHIRMLLHDFSRVPVDSAVSRSLRARYGLAPEEIDSYFERWGEYRFLGYKLSSSTR